ncbi:MAG: hypothetical protein NTY66_03265 [Candidatus Vogelbacteria bacterium]|nr:hypothetical protein [Candidatus Vogelbacteria bacterium]
MKLQHLILGILLALSFLAGPQVQAYAVEPVQIDPSRQDFVVGPGKVDLVLRPGESRVIEVMVSNRTGEGRYFEIKFNDFIGSNDLTSPVILTAEKGVNTMKDFLSVPERSFFLKNGQRSRIPVTISIPSGAEPGGRYVSILISTLTPLDKSSVAAGTKGGVPLITQTGTLVFITVPGEVKIEGKLSDFYTRNRQWIFSSAKNTVFDLVYENTGKIHLNPYGLVVVKNIFGQEIRRIELPSWFAMPNALRLREVKLVSDPKKDNVFMFGRYTAEAKIFRGYGDQFDTKSLAFWVIPWPLLLLALLIIFLLVWSFRSIKRYIATHYRRIDPPAGGGGTVPSSGPGGTNLPPLN